MRDILLAMALLLFSILGYWLMGRVDRFLQSGGIQPIPQRDAKHNPRMAILRSLRNKSVL